MTRSLSDPNSVLQSVSLYASLYVLLQLVLIGPATQTLTGILLFVVLGVTLAIESRDLLVLSFPFMLVQHAFSDSLGLSNNWIFGDFVFPVSMIYVVIGVLSLLLVWRFLRAGCLWLDQYSMFLFLMLVAGFLMSELPSPNEFANDAVILIAALVYSMYVTNVLSPPQIRRLLWYVIMVPIGIMWGSIVLFAVDVIASTGLYNDYLTIQLFVFAVVVGMLFERDRFSPFVFGLSFLTAVVYIGVFIAGLINSGTGTSKLVFLAIIICLGVLKQYRINGLRSLPVVVGLVVLASGCVYMVLYLFTDLLLPLRFLVFKFVSVFTLDLHQIEHSPAVRIIELLNITAEHLQRGLPFLVFGDGIGSYFTDMYYPFETYVQLRPSDFAESALESGRFYRPHTNFGGYLLLKYGLFGVLTMLGVAFAGVRTYFNTRGIASIVSLALALTVPVFGFGIKISILFGVLLGLYVLFSRGIISEDVLVRSS